MKRLATILSVLVATTVLSACGGGDGEKVAYRPIAYGQNNQCYYVNDPVETQLLMEQGLCQQSWVPTAMPLAWHQMYYPYYSSPAYYGVYVPMATRTVYVERERSWGTQQKTAINREAKKATYQGSNGKEVSASKIGATKYGAGNRFGPTGTKFGGGSRTATTPESGTPVKATPTPVTAKATPAPKAEAPKPKTPAPKPSSPKVSPPKSSGGSKSYGGGSRGGSGVRSGGGSYGGGSRGGRR